MREHIDKIKATLAFDEHSARTLIRGAPGTEPISVPTFPTWPCVRLNGLEIALFSIPSGGLSFLRYQHPLVVEAVTEFCAEAYPDGPPVIASSPPEIPQEDDDDDE